ncbi:hypothetical protein [Actinomadura sp. 6N118]|uniref:hypothetical protein n=1 Tax=Actinomadura sp. 6N118 TaxID=3375151 RepID=UPI0037AD9F84
MVLLLICMVRSALALDHPREARLYWLRMIGCPALLLSSMVLAVNEHPLQARFELSKSSLDAYVRTLSDLRVGASSCAQTGSTRRRVGLFTIGCAQRPVADVVTIEVGSDAMTPSAQVWYLVWESTPNSGTQGRLSSHWSLALHD